MSKVTYNGCVYNIVRDGMLWDRHRPHYAIFDAEGYRLLTNFRPAKLSAYQKAVELSDEGNRNFKIVLDFTPMASDDNTLQATDWGHSLWVRPEYKELSKFWKLFDAVE